MAACQSQHHSHVQKVKRNLYMLQIIRALGGSPSSVSTPSI
ncbi:hypothetical protein FOQG_07615 [Fusarium oxysporum f. sp. raphani 54005]|uniref:Uncharacterized protein n=4 Tax=Fusarium oxysporum TaxID=5507 RepID=X0C535_FUSOX|nr:hypothetical protein FOVG_15195 [Fusarium oxysporum f. sp. pisi HDV247]EXK89520.1 hypothetical protein FOQG_07615 [Fusarium oxysporum f. sp. raphani 54005]EXL67826.1 hypothetical protein FOPG_16074 [Fusarium oxysporum f. sp. conglutinans race 2 54008]EXM22033.1 hypothetical protein FOTG_10316 [Fusarium oxysporum f. sp. vasinfectum 25433]